MQDFHNLIKADISDENKFVLIKSSFLFENINLSWSYKSKNYFIHFYLDKLDILLFIT